jgi:hypothetical protein
MSQFNPELTLADQVWVEAIKLERLYRDLDQERMVQSERLLWNLLRTGIHTPLGNF